MELVHIREHPRKSPGHQIHSALAYTLGGLPALGDRVSPHIHRTGEEVEAQMAM